jgi:hypothetical protein
VCSQVFLTVANEPALGHLGVKDPMLGHAAVRNVDLEDSAGQFHLGS